MFCLSLCKVSDVWFMLCYWLVSQWYNDVGIIWYICVISGQES